MIRFCVPLLLFSFFWVPTSAKAGSETKVSVIVLPGDDKPTEGLIQQRMLDEAFHNSGDDFPWILVAFQRITPELTQGDVADLMDELMKKGKKAYQYMKLDKAHKYFERAAALLKKRPLTRCEPEKPAEMYLYWARSVLDAGDDTTAQEILGQIQRFDPDAGPDPAVMPPKLVATFDLATDERGQKPKSKALLEIGPSPGTIVVNCRRMPPGVAEYTGVEGDELWVAAEIAGGTFASTFTLPGGKRRQLTIFSGQGNDPLNISRRMLSLNRRMLSMGDLHARPDGDLDRLADDLRVKALLLGQVKHRQAKNVLYVGLYIPSKGLNAEPIPVPLDPSGQPLAQDLSDAFSSMAKQFSSPMVIAALNPPAESKKDTIEQAATTPPPKKIKTKKESESGPAWYRTWWFWTATGAVLAGAVATGLVLGLSNSAVEPSGKVVLSISQP